MCQETNSQCKLITQVIKVSFDYHLYTISKFKAMIFVMHAEMHAKALINYSYNYLPYRTYINLSYSTLSAVSYIYSMPLDTKNM